MSLWLLLGIVCITGAVGGVINALISDNGFIMPRREEIDKIRIIRPGFLGNIIVGATAAGISWGLYGPFASFPLFQPSGIPLQSANLTLSALVGAALVGIGGARWLTNEVDKTILKAATRKAALKATGRPAVPLAAPASPDIENIMRASPSQILNTIEKL